MGERYISNGQADQPGIAHEFDTANELTSENARIVSFKNAGEEVASIDKDGNLSCADSSITAKKLTGLAEGTDSAITSSDTILDALAKLQKQIDSL